MANGLASIGDDLINQVRIAMKSLTSSNRLDALHGLSPSGVNQYKADLLDAMALVALDAIDNARKEVPKAKKVKLSIQNVDKLPAKLRDKIKTRNQLLVGKQVGDLQKVIEFAYAQNEDTTDSDSLIIQDMKDSAVGFIEGTAIDAGASLTAANTINDAREAFFFDDEVLQEIDAFEFVNGDPVTPICQDLAGTIFAKDDPNMFRYTPPLHWNCKSYIQPILSGDLGKRKIEELKPSTAKLESQIQFSEYKHEKVDYERELAIIHGHALLDGNGDSHDHG